MIPQDFVTEWRAQAPWVADRQVEQDLVISRALVELYSRPQVRDAVAFRGGTALYKLHLKPAARYSEDLDFVQISPGEIGPTLEAIREALDGWLGKPRWKQAEGRVTLSYRFLSEGLPPTPSRLKVEINSREHFSIYGFTEELFEVRSRWFTGSSRVRTYELDELLGTKLRALYQRKKGRDLFDLSLALRCGRVAPERILEAFVRYMQASGSRVTRAMFERNLAAKTTDAAFLADISPLLAKGASWDLDEALALVECELIQRLPGDPWRRR